MNVVCFLSVVICVVVDVDRLSRISMGLCVLWGMW